MFRNHLLVFKPFNDTYGRWNTWQEPKLNLMSSVVLVFDVQRFDRQFHMVGCDLCQIYWDFCFIVLGNLFLNKYCFIDKHQQLIKCYLWVWNLRRWFLLIVKKGIRFNLVVYLLFRCWVWSTYVVLCQKCDANSLGWLLLWFLLRCVWRLWANEWVTQDLRFYYLSILVL